MIATSNGVEYAPDKAATLTAGMARKPGVNPPGRRQEDDHNLVAFYQNQEGDVFAGDVMHTLRAGAGAGAGRRPMVCVTGDKTHTLTCEGSDASEDGTGRATPIVAPDVYQCHGSNVGPMGTLRQGNGAVTGGVPFMADTGVRRLSPMECERLQGFPDGWTAEGADGKPMSDAQRYRQMGNSLAIPVVEWIANRLVGVHKRLPTACL